MTSFGCAETKSGTKLLVKGGTVVNAHLQEVADVYIDDGIIVAVQPDINVRKRCHLFICTIMILNCIVFDIKI